MSADYRVTLTLGPTLAGATYSWTVDKGDPPTLPALLDGLSVSWQFPDANLFPVQPEPATASFSILMETATSLPGVDVGTPVLLRVWAGTVIGGVEYDAVTFRGRLGEPKGRPVTFGHPDTGEDVHGWRLDLIAVDLYADLSEYTPTGTEPDWLIGGTAWADWLFQQAGLAVPLKPGVTSGDAEGTAHYPSQDGGGTIVEGTDLAAAVEAYLSQTAYGGDPSWPINHWGDVWGESPFWWDLYADYGWRRPIVRPNVDASGTVDPVNPFRYEWASRRYGYASAIGPTAPARFALLASGKYGPEIAAPAAAPDMTVVIDADYLDYDAEWSRTKFDDPNEIVVSTSMPASQFEPPTYPLWRVRTVSSRLPGEAPSHVDIADTRIASGFEARYLAEMYLDDAANADVQWAAEGFVWYASQDPSWPCNRSLFPGTHTHAQDYSAPVVITGIPANQNPDPRPWHAGVVKSATWEFSGGEFAISFTLYPRVPRPFAIADNAMTWTELKADHPTLTVDQLDDDYRWIDYRLIRSTTFD